MNTPVTTAVPGVRPAAPRASETGRSSGAAPFASALDGALSERASDRGVERRGMRDDRATEHAAAKAQRVEERSRRAADRAGEKADRTAGEAPPDAPGTTSRRTADAEETVPGEAAPGGGDQRTDTTGASAEVPRGGLPALWALIMGGSLTGARPGDAAAGPVPPAVVPVATAPADAVAPLPAGSIVSAEPLVDGAATAAAGTVVGAPAAEVPETVVPSAPAGAATAPAAPGSRSPATFPAVIAAAGAVVTATSAPAPSAVLLGVPASTAPGNLAQTAVVTATPGTPPPVPVPPATDAEVALVAGSADLAVAPLGSPSGEAPSADADGTGQNSSGGAPAAVGTTGPTTAGTAGPAPATAAVAGVDSAPGSEPAPPVGSQVARQVAVLRGGPDGAHSMTLVLTPETLGPVEVQVTVTKGSVELALRGAHEQGRAALLDGLPDLRRDLEAAGLSCARLEVDRETGGSFLDRQPAQQQSTGERSGQHGRSDERSRPWGRTADSGGSGTSAPQNRSTSSGVDVLA